MGHMNVMWYTAKFDEACWQLLAMVGLHPSRFAEDGTGMAAVEQRIQYRRELHPGDTITVQSTLLELTDKSVHMLHKMLHDASGEIAATTIIVGVHIDARTRRAIRLPEDVRERAIAITEGHKRVPDYLLQFVDISQNTVIDLGSYDHKMNERSTHVWGGEAW
jgi:acyl-CoA thioester hydrolase